MVCFQMCIMLSLLFLHLVWTYYILKIFVIVLATGEVVDNRSSDDGSSNENELIINDDHNELDNQIYCIANSTINNIKLN